MMDQAKALANRLNADDVVLSSWSMIAEPLVAETLARLFSA